MKAEIKSEETKVFEPIKLELTIESMSQLGFYCSMLNVAKSEMIKFLMERGAHYGEFEADDINDYAEWDRLDDIYNERKAQGF